MAFLCDNCGKKMYDGVEFVLEEGKDEKDYVCSKCYKMLTNLVSIKRSEQ